MRKISLEPIYQAIMGRILSGSLPEGAHLPPERELSGQYGIARNTLRMVLKRLEDEGYLERHRRIGTIVSRPHKSDKIHFLLPCPDFLEDKYADFSSDCVQLLSKVSREVYNHDGSLRLLYATDDNEYGHFNMQNFEGIAAGSRVIVNHAWYLPLIPFLLKRGARVAFIGHATEELHVMEQYADSCHFFFQNCYQEAYDMYLHMHAQGARRIGIVGLFCADAYPMLMGFRHAARDLGGDESLVFNMNDENTRGKETMGMRWDFFKTCLQKHGNLDGMIAMGSLFSDATRERLRDLIQVPEGMQLGIVGVFADTVTVPEGVLVSQTSLTQAARQAVECLQAPEWQPGIDYLPYKILQRSGAQEVSFY